MAMDLGSDPSDPLGYLGTPTRTVAMNSDGSYPDKQTNTPLFTRPTASGTVAAGYTYLTIHNSGNANGTVLGTPLKPGEGVTFAPMHGKLPSVAYDATGTEFMIVAN